jgi:hypothetical protein
VNKLCIRFYCHHIKPCQTHRSSLKELSWSQATERTLRRVQDNPRRLGKSQIKLVGLAPLEAGASRGMEAGFTSSSGGVRASSVCRETGTARRGAIRYRSEPSQCSPGGFRAWANRSYPEGKWLLLRASTERKLLAVNKNAALHQRRREADKGSLRAGEVRRLGRPHLPRVGDPETDRWPVSKRQPER